MAGFDNEVLFCLGERLLPSNAQEILLMQQQSTDVARINYTGNPNGNVAANPSSLCHDPVSGNVYFKQTGTGNTGWVIVQNTVSTSNATPQFSSGILNFGLSNLLLGNNGSTISSGIGNVGYGLDALDSISVADACTGIGFQALKSCATSGNTGIGFQSLTSLTSGGQNLAAGYKSLASSVGGTANTGIGFNSLTNLGASGNTNTALGSSSAASLQSGNSNVIIGYNSASNYTSSESNNIIISNSGSSGESNKIRIGTTGVQNETFMAGIASASSIPSSTIVLVSGVNGQLSSAGTGSSGQTLTSKGSSSPTWQFHGWNVSAATQGTTLTASTTYYCPNAGTPTTNDALVNTKFVLVRQGIIKKVYMQLANTGTLSSAELASFGISVNGGAPTYVFNNQLDFSTASSSLVSGGTLALLVSPGDYLQFIILTPAWTILPTDAQISFGVLIEPN